MIQGCCWFHILSPRLVVAKLRSQSKPSMMQAGQALAVQILTSDFTVWVLISRL